MTEEMLRELTPERTPRLIEASGPGALVRWFERNRRVFVPWEDDGDHLAVSVVEGILTVVVDVDEEMIPERERDGILQALEGPPGNDDDDDAFPERIKWTILGKLARDGPLKALCFEVAECFHDYYQCRRVQIVAWCAGVRFGKVAANVDPNSFYIDGSRDFERNRARLLLYENNAWHRRWRRLAIPPDDDDDDEYDENEEYMKEYLKEHHPDEYLEEYGEDDDDVVVVVADDDDWEHRYPVAQREPRWT